MSRIGKKPVEIPQGVKVEQKGRQVKVSGPLGALEMDCHPRITMTVDGSANRVEVVNPRPEDRKGKQLHGTMRALLANMVTGVSKGFERKMAIYGTGYSVKEQGGKLVLQIGFCHPVELAIPKGVSVKIDVPATRGNDIPAKFTLSGMDKGVLGQFAANVRRIRPPEPYKGKGIRYADEQVQRKMGKAFASGGA
ncbi:50S ribosomal protein L6 [Anaerobaca lacustris]|uniref:Large ribosomal subunit protein uL6 n=1 Tax=Anaerobaca lacustris TaxID=3044600 RepID=A0AAW6TU74_9BACT|nr:50S ribosomal protein L6 [Sedimentisphaerales bacterium M17dextr]